MITVLCGPPGSGKTTLATRLQRRMVGGPPVGDMSDWLKEASSLQRSSLADRQNQGQLWPDDLVCEVWERRMMGREYSHGVIMAGFPRTLEQAERLLMVSRLKFTSADHPAVVVELKLGRAESNQRRLKRIAEAQERGLEGRRDDEEEVFARRWEAFEFLTKPMIESLKSQHSAPVITISAAPPVDQVTDELFEKLTAKGVTFRPPAAGCFHP